MIKKLLITVLCAGLLASGATKKLNKASAAEREETDITTFTLEHVDTDKVIGTPGAIYSYNLEMEDFEKATKIKEGDVLENCLIIFDRSINMESGKGENYLLSGVNEIFFDGSNENDSLCYRKESKISGIPGYTNGDYQLVYVNGYFGEVQNMKGTHYIYNDSAYKCVPVEIGDKIIGTKFYNATNLLFDTNNHLVPYGDSIGISIDGNPPYPADSYMTTYGDNFYEFSQPFEVGGYLIGEDSVVTSINSNCYKLVEFKNAESGEDNEEPGEDNEESKTFFDNANDWVNDKLGLGLSAGAFGTIVLVIALFVLFRKK